MLKQFKNYKVIKTPIKGKNYRLWVADTDIKKKVGLSQVKKLPRGWGMIFVYNYDVKNSFTMKNTSIPLTIIFLDKNMKIVDLHMCKPFQSGSIQPKDFYRYVVEI